MNIKQAKEEIIHTLQAYFSRDALGNYRIPSIRQRPILLMGPPGVGKTQIMEQIAAECAVGLVSYTITHHTRQSAMGLPFIRERIYGGQPVSVTEYTMSEILSSVHSLMDRTGLREGILFLDEINCVSETLSPMMLQFLQCKTFGNQRLPEGWLIVAAGNPPEYNKSVREFDVVTLDRVRRMDVEADFPVWKEYADRRGLHGAVVSYLDIRREFFFRMETDTEGLHFVTPRGWEDLAELITVHEELGLPVNRNVVGEYIQLPRVARDFANYLELYDKYRRAYRIGEILEGVWQPVTVSELRSAPFDEKIAVLGLLFSRLTTSARAAWRQDALTAALHVSLTEFRDTISTADREVNKTDREAENHHEPAGPEKGNPSTNPEAVLEQLLEARRESLRKAQEAGRTDPEQRNLSQREILILEEYLHRLRQSADFNRQDTGTAQDTNAAQNTDAGAGQTVETKRLSRHPEAVMDAVRDWFSIEIKERERLGAETGAQFDNAFRFLEEALGQGQEMVLFVTEVTAGFFTSWFVENFGCEAYFRHNRELLFVHLEDRLRRKIAALSTAGSSEALSRQEAADP